MCLSSARQHPASTPAPNAIEENFAEISSAKVLHVISF
jgi:hypothetical protein